MTTLDLSPDQLLSTTRAVRKRLDFDRPLEVSVIQECIEIALQAPSGSNAQGWHFYVVTDEAKRKAIGDIYRRGFELYRGDAGLSPCAGGGRAEPRRRPTNGTRCRIRRIPGREHASSAGLDHPVRERAHGPSAGQHGRDRPGQPVRIDFARLLELHAGGPSPRHWDLLDDDPPDVRRRGRQPAGHSLR